MAIIPGDEKVFMVDKRTNTIYGGSAALQAMQQWYTMQDVIDSIPVTPGDTPTLQQVTEAGSISDYPLTLSSPYGPAIYASSANGTVISAQAIGMGTSINAYSPNGAGIEAVSDSGTGINASSTSFTGVRASSVFGHAIDASSTDGYAVKGTSFYGAGGRFDSSESYGVWATSENLTAGMFTSNTGNGVWGQSSADSGGYFYSEYGNGGYFTSGAGYSLVAAESAAKPGGGSWDAWSDSRVKENIKPYVKGLTEILLVNPVNYGYNGLANTLKGIEYTGVIAQEIKDIFPETVNTYKAKLNEEDVEKTELYSFNSTALTFALINAVKELKAEIDLLKAK